MTSSSSESINLRVKSKGISCCLLSQRYLRSHPSPIKKVVNEVLTLEYLPNFKCCIYISEGEAGEVLVWSLAGEGVEANCNC